VWVREDVKDRITEFRGQKPDWFDGTEECWIRVCTIVHSLNNYCEAAETENIRLNHMVLELLDAVPCN
jgi:hypothetical protein